MYERCASAALYRWDLGNLMLSSFYFGATENCCTVIEALTTHHYGYILRFTKPLIVKIPSSEVALTRARQWGNRKVVLGLMP